MDVFSDLKTTTTKTFNIGLLADIVYGRSFKLCMIITFSGGLAVHNRLMTLTLFQSHKFVGFIGCKYALCTWCVCK